MEKKQNKNIILITRPLPAGKELCEEIRKDGGETLLFPTIEIKPKKIPAEIIKRLPTQDWIIFSSPQSVYNSHLAIPKHIKIAAIGEGTAKALRAAHYSVAAKPKDEWNSEALLALPQFQNLENKKITIVRGVGGREVLAQELEKRGATITHAIAYERLLPRIDTTMVKQLIADHRISVCVCTSKDSLTNLKILLETVWDNLKNIPVIVISMRMHAAAKELGFTNILLAQNASHHAIITVLKKGRFMEISMENTNQLNTKPAKPRHYPWGNMGILITALAFVILFGGLYIANMRVLHTQTHLANISDSLVTKINENQQVINNLQKAAQDNQLKYQSLQEELTSQAQTVNNLRNKELGNKDEWLVNESQYLVKLANDNLQVGENIPLIISLLENADAKLRDSTDPKLVPVRKALAEDIAAFQALPTVDITGIYLKLSALNNAVDKLALPNHRPEAEADLPTQKKRLPWWKRGLQQTWTSLKQIVVVRYNNSGEMPFIAPSEQDFLYLNLHAKFEQAMFALMNRQEAIYRNSLQQIQDWIGKYFLQEDPATQAQLANLKELQGMIINPGLPNLSKSLNAFHDYLANASKQSNASQPASTPNAVTPTTSTAN